MGVPLRKCVGCRAKKPKNELLKVMRPPKKEGPGDVFVVLNQSKHKEGRGAYVCKSAECLRAARKKRGFERAFARKIDPFIYETLEGAVAESG